MTIQTYRGKVHRNPYSHFTYVLYTCAEDYLHDIAQCLPNLNVLHAKQHDAYIHKRSTRPPFPTSYISEDPLAPAFANSTQLYDAPAVIRFMYDAADLHPPSEPGSVQDMENMVRIYDYLSSKERYNPITHEVSNLGEVVGRHFLYYLPPKQQVFGFACLKFLHRSNIFASFGGGAFIARDIVENMPVGPSSRPFVGAIYDAPSRGNASIPKPLSLAVDEHFYGPDEDSILSALKKAIGDFGDALLAGPNGEMLNLADINDDAPSSKEPDNIDFNEEVIHPKRVKWCKRHTMTHFFRIDMEARTMIHTLCRRVLNCAPSELGDQHISVNTITQYSAHMADLIAHSLKIYSAPPYCGVTNHSFDFEHYYRDHELTLLREFNIADIDKSDDDDDFFSQYTLG